MIQNRSNPDWTTINLSRLRALPIYKLPPTYQLQNEPGNGCAGDPPGYPTYFTRSVYNQTGNTPRNAPQYVIKDGATLRIVISKFAAYDEWEKKMRRLWVPLPIDHPRTLAWMAATYAHHKHCYYDVAGLVKKPEYGRPGTVIFPDNLMLGGYKTFRDDPRFSNEWRSREKAAIDLYNLELMQKVTDVAIPENHQAVQIIRRYYPEHQPNLEWIDHAPVHPGNWWSTASVQPAPDECPGEYTMKHPTGTTWCQWCGWHNPKEA
jgi:hypothetical protein